MAEEAKRSDALGIAIQMEQEGMKFYHEAAGRVTHPFSRKMFASLAADEKRHAQVFREMAARRGVRPAAADEIDPEGAVKRIRALFRSVAKQVTKDFKPTADDIEVLRIAKGMERKAFDFYSATAAAATDAQEAGILRVIAEEENQHWRILDDTQLYLTDPAEWHIKEEKPLIDGG